MLGIACVVALVASGPFASAQIVRWTDDRGEIHITEGLDSVPPPFRGTAQILSRSQPPAPPRPPAAGTEIPAVARGAAVISFAPGKPVMATARINGSATIAMMIDTGASITVVHPSVMMALGVNLHDAPTIPLTGIGGARRARVIVLDRLEVGGAMVAPLRVAVLDTGPPGQGLIGRDFLRHFAVGMDNRTGTFTLRARSDAPVVVVPPSIPPPPPPQR